MSHIILASVLFLVTHVGVSSTRVRDQLVEVLGDGGYLLLYSLVALLSLSYLIWLFAELPRFDYLWMPSPELYAVARWLMPVASIFVVGGLLVRQPISEGPRGMTRITRHPFQWGVVVWAVAHMIANGDTISVVFFGTFALLGGAGGLLIDRKRALTDNPDSESDGIPDGWQAYAAVTSNLPFLAVARGRNRLVVGELWLPVLLGLVLYGLLTVSHPWLSGVRIR